MKTKTNIPFTQSIATRLLLVSLALYIVVVICQNMNHIWMDYKYEKTKILNDMGDIENAFKDGLAVNLWALDQKALEATVQGILKTPTVVGMKIWNANGVLITIGGIVATQNGDRGETDLHVNLLGCAEQEKTVHKDEHHDYELYEHNFPIKYNFERENETIGKAAIYSCSSIIYQQIKFQLTIMIINSLLTLITFSIALLWAFNKYLRKPLKILTDGTADISLDTLESFSIDINTTGQNEIKVLEEAITDMVGNLNNSVNKRIQAEKVIKTKNEELEKERWFKTGQAELTEKMSGEKNLQILSRDIIVYLSHYLNAQVGTFYIARENNFVLEGSFAVNKEKLTQKIIKPGQGFIGEAALQKKYILTREIPENYIKIESSLVSAGVNNLLVFPILLDEDIKGVIEIASLDPFANRHIEFVSRVSENIARVVNSTQSRFKTERLLQQTQQQAEELQENNEELQAQQEELSAANEALHTQEEELRVSNENLEKKSKNLEQQKQLIEESNQSLSLTRDDLVQKAKELELSNKYKSEFLANMSHELRTPLNSILLLSQHLADNKKNNLTKKQVECAHTVHTSGNELLNLINEVLDLSKVESGKIVLETEPVHFTDISFAMERIFKALADKKGIDFKIDIDSNLPDTIITDGQRLNQILKNLLSNALKFTAKGHVALEICSFSKKIGIPIKNPIAFKVKDTGPGIPKNKQAVVFQAFKQVDGSTSRKYGGTGLGLSISRELANLLGGKLILKSEPGKGSIFSLIIPENFQQEQENLQETGLSKKPNQPIASIQLKNQIISGTSETQEYVPDDRKTITKDSRSILIIEDDPVFAKTLRDAAREKEFKVIVAETGEAGLYCTEYYSPDGIILDLTLPGMDGKTVLSRLKEGLDTRHIPVQIISGTEKVLDTMHMGAVDFLEKPVSMETLNHAFDSIENIISNKTKKILIVEDNKTIREMLTNLISDKKIKTMTASTGNRAIELIKEYDFNCMILDLGLPDMTGFELLKKMEKQNGSNIPIIIHTARDLTSEERANLDKFSRKIVLKDVTSKEKILDETLLFLHSVEAELPEEKRDILKKIHDRESIFKDKKILIVDDDMRNVFALISILEDKGITTVVAENGKKSIEQLKENSDTNLVLMDIMMPEMDGYTAMTKIRAIESKIRNIPIIALTAKAMKGDRAKCIKAGANDYLSKPVDADKLLSMLRVWLY